MKTTEFSKIKGEIANVSALHAWLDKSIKYLQNGLYTIKIVGKSRNRSVAQNRLMWLWFACIEQETGQEAMDVHDYYTLKYLSREIVDLRTGLLVRVGGHTSTLTSEAFTDFLNKVQADAATELGITLPIPEEEGFEEFEETYKQFVR